ncbi:hypothetical protein [Siminovitchia fordii]|uniref:Uncharacterized protein n=1 Tax=Siminovitchia fordii TaxID=254759 RepID=A0ABQ4K9X1_9BACI|nr:hypothetical protein [Siminovitchia fordii]GIN22512.1 hypothetical protein J1TS3_36460 [Siminovitchia fordii]
MKNKSYEVNNVSLNTHRKFCVTVGRAKESEYVIKGLDERITNMIEKYLESIDVPVERKEDKKFDMDELAKGYSAMSELNQNEDQDYILGMKELVKNKSL